MLDWNESLMNTHRSLNAKLRMICLTGNWRKDCNWAKFLKEWKTDTK